jgi:GT2 family glycosyltransferase
MKESISGPREGTAAAARAVPHGGRRFVGANPPVERRHDVDVVIVNWNTADDVAACVESLRGATGGRLARVVVVDNASTDGSAELLERCTDVHVVHATRNLGFAGGANLGAQHTGSRLLLFLNPDARVLPETIAVAADFLDAHPEFGIVGPLLVDGDGAWQPSAGRFNVLGHLVLDTRLARRQPRRSRAVDWIHGAFLLISRDLFRRLGGFDERFFMYGEDMDLCARARAAGYRTAIVPQARAVHYGNRSGAKRFGGSRDSEVVKGEMRFYAWSGKPGELALFRAVAVAKFTTKGLLCLLAGRRERAASSWNVARTCALFRPESVARRSTWPT